MSREFFKAWGIYRSDGKIKSREQASSPLPALIGVDEFQPVIPRRVGLHQSPPPLHRPSSECCTVVFPVEVFAANGDVGLICLCQPWGQPQFVALVDETTQTYTLEKGDFMETVVLTHVVGKQYLQYLKRKLSIPVHYFWNPEMAEADAKSKSRKTE